MKKVGIRNLDNLDRLDFIALKKNVTAKEIGKQFGLSIRAIHSWLADKVAKEVIVCDKTHKIHQYQLGNVRL